MKSLITAVSLAALAFSTQALTIELDSTRADNSVSVSLSAGHYSIQYLSGSWNPWNNTTCNVPLLGCDNSYSGWINNFSLWFDSDWHDFGSKSGAGARTFMSSADSLAAAQAQTMEFTLGTAQTVEFKIRDTVYQDNHGSVILGLPVAAVPEPASALLMGAGLAGMLGAVMRRRQGMKPQAPALPTVLGK